MSSNLTDLTSAEGTIKVIDHLATKFSDILPQPTWKFPSTIFSLKVTGIISLSLLIVCFIILFVLYIVISKNIKGRKRVVTKDKDGNVIDVVKIRENAITETKCEEKEDKDGNNVETCTVAPDLSKVWMIGSILIITLILGLFYPIFKTLRDHHYGVRLRKQNIHHVLFVEFIHKLLGVDMV